MRALTLHGVADVRCERVPEPTIESPSDALVRVTAAAICGSDLHVYHGRETGCDPGTVMGHELTGAVVAVGPEVARVAVGQRVACPFTTSCGDCPPCRRGLTARCVRGQLFGWVQGGVGLQGGQAELVRVPLADATLVPLPDGLGPEAALLAGDVLSTGTFVVEQGGVGRRTPVAIVGCGPVGLMAVVAAVERGAAPLLALDRVPARLALAARLGATPIDIDAADPVAAVRAATDGEGVAVVCEVVGSPQATRLALALVRPGGTLSIAGVHTEPHFAFAPAEAYDRNLTLRIGRSPARRLMPEALALLVRRQDALTAVFTHRMPFSEGAEAYRLFDARADGCVKVLLTPD